MKKKLMRSLFIAIYHRYIAFHNSFLPESVKLKAFTERPLSAVQRLYKHKNWIFLQDNTPQHRSYLVQDFLTKNT